MLAAYTYQTRRQQLWFGMDRDTRCQSCRSPADAVLKFCPELELEHRDRRLHPSQISQGQDSPPELQ